MNNNYDIKIMDLDGNDIASTKFAKSVIEVINKQEFALSSIGYALINKGIIKDYNGTLFQEKLSITLIDKHNNYYDVIIKKKNNTSVKEKYTIKIFDIDGNNINIHDFMLTALRRLPAHMPPHMLKEMVDIPFEKWRSTPEVLLKHILNKYNYNLYSVGEELLKLRIFKKYHVGADSDIKKIITITDFRDDYFDIILNKNKNYVETKSKTIKNKVQKVNYEEKATIIAGQMGIVSYRVNGKNLIWNVSYPAYLSNKRYTVQHIINMDTMQEETQTLQRYDVKGEVNR